MAAIGSGTAVHKDSTANCALPAKATALIRIASAGVMPAPTAAAPKATPNGMALTQNGAMSFMPCQTPARVKVAGGRCSVDFP